MTKDQLLVKVFKRLYIALGNVYITLKINKI